MTSRPCSTLRRVEPYATDTLVYPPLTCSILAVPSDGSNPMQPFYLEEEERTAKLLQYPQTGRTLCNKRGCISVHGNSISCSTLNRSKPYATRPHELKTVA